MRVLIFLAAATLTGCAASSYCVGEQDYQKATSVPPIRSAEGAPVPESPSALKIPDPPANSVAFGELSKDEEGDDEVRCLDTPPSLATPPAPKPAETPAVPQAEEKPKG